MKIRRTIIVIYFFISSFSCFSQEFAQKKAVSWAELQKKDLKSTSENSQSFLYQCPSNKSSLEKLKGKQRYSYIFFTDYFWTEFTDELGQTCFVKYSDEKRMKKGSEVLTRTQAFILLTASEFYGVSYEHRPIVHFYMALQEQAIREQETLKYGGVSNIINFMNKHPAEVLIKKKELKVTKAGFATFNTYTPIEFLEQSYSKETLEKLIKNVKENTPNRMSNGKYPFRTIEDLFTEVKKEISQGIDSVDSVINNY